MKDWAALLLKMKTKRGPAGEFPAAVHTRRQAFYTVAHVICSHLGIGTLWGRVFSLGLRMLKCHMYTKSSYTRVVDTTVGARLRGNFGCESN